MLDGDFCILHLPMFLVDGHCTTQKHKLMSLVWKNASIFSSKKKLASIPINSAKKYQDDKTNSIRVNFKAAYTPHVSIYFKRLVNGYLIFYVLRLC